MSVERMDHVGLVVDDLSAAVAFFVALGLSVDGETSVEGAWVDRIIGLDGARSQIAMLRTPDRHSCIELTEFDAPVSPPGDRAPAANVAGLRHLAFAVDDLDAVLSRLRAEGGELVGEVVEYEDIYRLCYVRGPAGVIIELAERLG